MLVVSFCDTFTEQGSWGHAASWEQTASQVSQGCVATPLAQSGIDKTKAHKTSSTVNFRAITMCLLVSLTLP